MHPLFESTQHFTAKRWAPSVLVLLTAALMTGCGTAPAPATAAAPSSPAAANYVPGDAVQGKAVFASTCAACHAKDGIGDGWAANLVTSDWVGKKGESAIFDFLSGHQESSLASLTDQNRRDAVAFVKNTLNQAKK